MSPREPARSMVRRCHAPPLQAGRKRLMRSKKVIVQNEHGIHTRVALRVLERSKELGSEVTICKGCLKADGCSILELMLLGAEKGSEIELIVNGGDEDRNLGAISEIFSDGSGI